MHGIRIKDSLGNSSMITTKMIFLLSSGNITMPNSLNAASEGWLANTYGTDIALGAAYPVTDISVLVYPVKFTFQAMTAPFPHYPPPKWYVYSWYAQPGATYYTKNASTGVMTPWTPGTMVNADQNSWDGMRGIIPLASWDYADGVTTISSVRIWAATAYTVYDFSASAPIEVYSVGNVGVSEVNYSIFLKGL
jgi:hypothetical protein